LVALLRPSQPLPRAFGGLYGESHPRLLCALLQLPSRRPLHLFSRAPAQATSRQPLHGLARNGPSSGFAGATALPLAYGHTAPCAPAVASPFANACANACAAVAAQVHAQCTVSVLANGPAPRNARPLEPRGGDGRG
jgi:hypothetical protein